MKDIAWMDRYWKEVLKVSTWKYDIKGSVSLRYNFGNGPKTATLELGYFPAAKEHSWGFN